MVVVMRDLTEEELKWVSKERFEYCGCESINCPICNIYMPEDEAAPLFEERIAAEIERSKKAEEANQREKAILAKPENERTTDDEIFIFQRNVSRRIAETCVKIVTDCINRDSPLTRYAQAEPDDESKRTIKFRRPVPLGTVE